MAEAPRDQNRVTTLIGTSSSDGITPIPIEVDPSTGALITTGSPTYKVSYLPHSTDSNINYIGKAVAGTASSSSIWQISKLDQSSGAVTTYADGDTNFDNIWDDRESLVYS